uniref:SpaA isopeptide-forming pilin-related protein n=1 Tax=Ruminococcus bicirculans (ex Wegman et al. 2014) TaxID=1160721 RepID=UPI003FD7B713
LTYAGQEFEVRDTVNTEFENEYQRVMIRLSKTMENDELSGIGSNGEYKNVRFGLFAAEDITAADGSVIPADGLISEVSLDENMTAKFDVQIPFGRYYVKEISTDEHYILNGEKYLVNFEYMGQDIQTVDIDCGQFVNLLKRGRIEGHKVDDKSEPLENAVFGLFTADCVKFSRDTAIMTAASDENGCFEFTDVPFGQYIVREIESPSGYILSDKEYAVSISEDGEVIEITTENKPITVEISKRDVYGNELVGAEMVLENADGETVDKWTSDGTNHIVSKLGAGEYVLKEIAAPDGYVIATDIKFTVDVYGNITVENVDSTAVSDNGYPLIVMVDDTTKARISKQDVTTGKELPGATLQIIDENGNVVEEWVSADEAHLVEGKLIAGKEYTLREIIAPDGYEIANEIKFTVNEDGSVTEVVMYDEHTPDLETPPTVTIDTPNTGVSADNSAELYLVATAVIMAFGMLICKKNDKKQRKDDVK